MNSIRSNRDEKLSTVKLTVVQYGILLMMLALSAGLWRLQVLGADNFRLLAEQNRIRKEPVLAARGKLFDREDRLVVDNYPSVSCFLVREQNHNVDADLPLIAKGLNLDLDQLRATLRRYRASPGYQPIPIKQDITADEQAFIEAHRNELPELETIDEERRLYPRDGFAAHLIGYVGEVSEDDLNNPALRLLRARRRGGQGGRRGDLRRAAARPGRLPRSHRGQPRPRGGLPAASSTPSPARTCG